MNNESNEENEMTNPTSDNGMAETEAIPSQNIVDETTEAIPSQSVDHDTTEVVTAQSVDDDTTETMLDQNTGVDVAAVEDNNQVQIDNAENEPPEVAKTEAETGSVSSASPQQAGYVPPSNFASGPATSGTYVRVPRDLPQQMPKPLPPAGPSKATIVLSLLPLFLGAVTLIVGVAFPMVFAPISGGVDARSLIALGFVVLGALLIVLAVLLGMASLIHGFAAKRKTKSRQ
ncbi:hypothetical protein OZX73_06770 [Bifidobacterium sp. ESL0775]|uniref:hypothetical protein n=1 Tax=Bifidobacterium sp. ESL0775 TaxID=2983230 RepID=UPI0023F99EA5|nr:hypothetical protein [Bifidobacterium sp. ESL0775]WEV68969.1 hypothetical protein OZX73_06770 [Bifidobacterium sp. ESL0775]